MNKMLLAVALIFGVNAFAEVDSAYFEISNVETKEIESKQIFPIMEEYPVLKTEVSGSVLDKVDPIAVLEFKLDQIVNLGKKVWAIVELGRPSANVTTEVATALPEGAHSWSDLTNWNLPESHTYQTSFKNAYGITVVSFTYRVVSVTGGSANGKGAYVGYASITPSDIYVLWGFNLNAQAAVKNVYNMGTSESPVGAMLLEMKYSVKTVMTSIDQAQDYAIGGNGQFKALE